MNGTQVAAHPRPGSDADGLYGYRVNHNLDVHVSDYAVTGGRASAQLPVRKDP